MFSLDIVLTSFVSFVITFMSIPVIIEIADKKRLYDIPDERKIHTRLIASLGGVGIFGGFLLACLLSIDGAVNPEFQSFFAAALIIFFLGLKDDLMILSPYKKFVGQIIAAAIIIHMGGLRIFEMHGFLGFDKISDTLSLTLTYMTIVVVMNSFNLIDGVDGLAASLGTVAMLIFGIYFFSVGLQAYAILSFTMAGSLIAFLIFNHHPAKIFMGDSGSLMIGLVSSILVIKFINVADAKSSVFPLTAVVALGFSILFVPLLDTLRVFAIRIMNGRSPFSPDRNHIHHLLLDRGLNHTRVVIACVIINLFFVALAYILQPIGPNYSLLLMLSLAFSGVGLLYYQKLKMSRLQVSKGVAGVGELKKTSKLVTIKTEANTTVASKN